MFTTWTKENSIDNKEPLKTKKITLPELMYLLLIKETGPETNKDKLCITNINNWDLTL